VVVRSNQKAKGWQKAHFVLDQTTSGILEAQRACTVPISRGLRRILVKWLKRWTADLEVPGSGPNGNRDLFSSGYTQPWPKLRRSVTFLFFWRGH